VKISGKELKRKENLPIHMELNETFEGDVFDNPEVDEEIVTAVINYLEANKKAYPWDIITVVSKEKEVEKKTVRRALRKLRQDNTIVPAEPFAGEFELS
jgi:actin-like ATPase involved in cell morphogenesis